MPRKLLILLLSIALAFEIVLTCMLFFAPATAMAQLGTALNAATALPAYLIGWFCLFVSLICGLALWRVINKGDYATLCYLLGLWWIGIGIGIYVAFKRPDNLLTDSLKGLLLVLLTWLSKRKISEPRRGAFY